MDRWLSFEVDLELLKHEMAERRREKEMRHLNHCSTIVLTIIIGSDVSLYLYKFSLAAEDEIKKGAIGA